VFATPSSSVQQACGRILRGGEGSDPVIVDIVDHYSLFFSQLAKRKAFYKKIGFEILGAPAKESPKETKTNKIMFIED
jgi:hypothetical protein